MVDSEKEYNLRKQVKKLAAYKGSGTELISVYIPAGAAVHDMAGKLREEMSQASNIKSKSTRTNVLGALERIIGHLKIFHKAPENGVAVFCGNISDNPAKVEFELMSLEPPQPLKVGIYRCDSRFFLEPLENLLEKKDSYGVLVMDGRDATLAVVKGTSLNIVKKLHSTAHQKINKGGQSQRRYQRLIEEQIEKYYGRVGVAMDEYFLNTVKSVMVGGPGPTKENFLKMSPFNYQIKILGPVDTGYTDEYGIREVMERSGDLLAEQEAIKEKRLVDRFIKAVINDDLATYGIKQVMDAINSKQADTVLLSEGLTYNIEKYICNSCNAESSKITKEKPLEKIDCSSCGKSQCMRLSEDMPLIDELTELAHENNIKVEIISTNTVEGAQFLNGFAGIGAFLRYKIQ
jgi:peptide chain release factor subunit 1